MAHLEIADAFHALSLSDPEYLLFRPGNENAWLWEKFNEVPRYLFRVFTPNSRGETNRTWTKSMDARDGNQNSRVDIFARESKEEMAGMLYRHLRWFPGPEDNLVSWTSSILFALVYIFHLHANTTHGSSFDDIYLCIIDTTEFPKEVFMRDMDLIQAYLQYSEDLQNFNGLRLRKDYYFGEYLSQGALKIKDRCQIVSARAIIRRGLYGLRHEFEDFSHWEPNPRPPWANATKEMRKVLNDTGFPEEQGHKIEVALNIAKLFESRWVLPVAANLIALIPYQRHDTAIISSFKEHDFTGTVFLPETTFKLIYLDDDRDSSSPVRTKIMVYDTLPEVQKFSRIMQAIYTDFCNTKIKRHVLEVEQHLRQAGILVMNHILNGEDSDVLDDIEEVVIKQLDMETALSQQLRDMISSRQLSHLNV